MGRGFNKARSLLPPTACDPLHPISMSGSSWLSNSASRSSLRCVPVLSWSSRGYPRSVALSSHLEPRPEPTATNVSSSKDRKTSQRFPLLGQATITLCILGGNCGDATVRGSLRSVHVTSALFVGQPDEPLRECLSCCGGLIGHGRYRFLMMRSISSFGFGGNHPQWRPRMQMPRLSTEAFVYRSHRYIW